MIVFDSMIASTVLNHFKQDSISVGNRTHIVLYTIGNESIKHVCWYDSFIKTHLSEIHKKKLTKRY